MKNALKLLIIISFISSIFSSCKKDKEEEVNKVAGTWIAKTLLFENCSNSGENGSQDLTGLKCNASNTVTCLEFSFIFNNDATFILSTKALINGESENETLPGTYTLTGNEIEICTGDNACDTIPIVDDIITLTSYDEDLGCDLSFTFEKE